jgi:hypothetical protein
MKLGKKIIALALFGMAVSGFANKGFYIVDAKVENVITYAQGNKAQIIFNKDFADTPNCARHSNKVMIDVSKVGGKAILSSALTAYTTKSTVRAGILGRCSLHEGWSDLNYLWLK